MRVEGRCVSCIIARGFEEVELATDDLKLQLEVMEELVGVVYRLLKEGGEVEHIPAYVGTMRERVVQRLTGCPDPYLEVKRRSNEAAWKLMPVLESYVEEERGLGERFRRACLVSALGNVIEYGVAGYRVPWDELEDMLERAQSEMAIDQVDLLFRSSRDASSVLLLTDNAGEIVFDRLLVATLRELGAEVTVAVKGSPVMNDATLEDAQAARMEELAEVITTGGGVVGVLPMWCSTEFLERYARADLVIAKGMGHWETLPEFTLPAPTAFLLRTKCAPVARSLGVPMGRNVVKILTGHRGPLGPLTSFHGRKEEPTQ